MTVDVDREPSGIRALLDANPIVGNARSGPKRFWTGREDKLMREHYAAGGVSLCLQYLPGRSASSIYQRAAHLGLRVPQKTGQVHDRRVWATSEAIDAIIRRTFQTKPDKGAVQACADTVARPRWWVSKRAVALGLVAPRFKEPAWTDAELDIVAEAAHKSPATLRKMLARHGFVRSETAILVKLKRLSLDRSDPNHMNANQLAQVMGVDRKTVASWIARGWLKATRRQATELDDFWQISRRDIAAFISDNVATVDLRKVDKFWFVDLLTHEGASAHAGGEKKGAAIVALAAARPDLDRNQIAAMLDSTPSIVSVVLSKARKNATGTATQEAVR